MQNQPQGKIARLPAALRDELNQRLLDGQSGRQILPWLNANPTVKKILEADFEGLHVTDTNLSIWRKGGYQDWLRRRESLTRLHEMSQWSIQLAKAGGGNLTEGAAAILSGRILEVLEKLDSLIRNLESADDPSNPPDSSDSPEEKIVSLNKIVADLAESLSTLRTGDQNNRRLANDDAKLKLLQKQVQVAEDKVQLAEREYQRKYVTGFLKHANDQAALAIANGSASNSDKIEQLGKLMFGENWK